MSLFDKILAARGISIDTVTEFLLPNYLKNNDPFLLPDMDKAVKRLILAKANQQPVVIYGDYDIDGLTASALLLESLRLFGIKDISVFIPSRFIEGYGLSISAIERIASSGAKLIITVDCGSQSKKEIIVANKLGIDVIVTDHHSVAVKQPPAVAVINPKRADSSYPFCDLSGVGVAFKLIQALQIKINGNPETSSGLPFGQEKWLLDLVALGTVCDVVSLTDENRINVYWGLKVLAKTRRIGLGALMAVSGIDPAKLNARLLGFGLGPRINASGRLETASHALELLTTESKTEAFEKAQYLDELNSKRQVDQAQIIKEAIVQAEKYCADPVLVVSGAGWSHGIVGIVASKLLEKYKKPCFVLQEMGDEAKGSARSYGDFSLVEAIDSCRDLIINGGGHNMAAGITLPTKNISLFRQRINKFYNSLALVGQPELLLPKADAVVDLSEINEDQANLIDQLEPFGNGNPRPVLKTTDLEVVGIRKMGTDGQHIKLQLKDKKGHKMSFLAFNAPETYYVNTGDYVSVWYHLDINEWQGNRSVEGRLLHIKVEKTSCK